MSMSQQVADEQMRANKEARQKGTKLLLNVRKEFLKGLDSSKAVGEFLKTSGDKAEMKLTKLAEDGLIPKESADNLKQQMRSSLGKFKDLDDGCFKTGANKQISDLLDAYSSKFCDGPGLLGGISKDRVQPTIDANLDKLVKDIKACIDAPDKIRIGADPAKDATGMMKEVMDQGNLVADKARKETLFRFDKQAMAERKKSGRLLDDISQKFNKLDAKAQAKGFAGKSIKVSEKTAQKATQEIAKQTGKKVAKTAAKTAAKTTAKAAVGAVAGVATGGIGFAVEAALLAVKELATAIGRATGVREQLNTQSLDRAR